LDGKVNCVDCDSSYRIESGILRLLDDNALDAESKGNLAVFSQNSASEGFDYETDLASLKDYKKNEFREFPPAERETVATAWRRSFDEWGYSI